MLLANCHADHPNYVQAAVSYFIDCDDAEHDMDSLSGFDDDIGVFNAVCDHLGHSDLKLLP